MLVPLAWLSAFGHRERAALFPGSCKMLTQCCQVIEAHSLIWAPAFFPDFTSVLKGHHWAVLCEVQHANMVLGVLHVISLGPCSLPAYDPAPEFLNLKVPEQDCPLTLSLAVWESFITHLLGDTQMNKVPFLPLKLFNKVEEWPNPDVALWSAGDIVVKEQTVGGQGSLLRGVNIWNDLMKMKRTWLGGKVEAKTRRRAF